MPSAGSLAWRGFDPARGLGVERIGFHQVGIPSMAGLEERFEEAHPDMVEGLYRFWCCKA